MVDKIYEIKNFIKKQKPLIHCITNPISVNQCANVILSIGAKPIMAEHPEEVCEITATADGLMLNLGSITDTKMEAMLISASKANEKGIPIVLDAVGVACSGLRRKYIIDLLGKATMSVIKGNYSEINALYNEQYSSVGVDADASITRDKVKEAAVSLALKYQAVILATGQTDVVTDGKRTVCVKNGTSQLASVTGTGCMLGALCCAFTAVASPMDAAACACYYFGICGELAKTDKGNGSFMVNLMDRISTSTKDEILDVEEKQ